MAAGKMATWNQGKTGHTGDHRVRCSKTGHSGVCRSAQPQPQPQPRKPFYEGKSNRNFKTGHSGRPRLLAALRSSQRAGSGSEASKARPAVFAGDAPWKDRKSGLRYDTSCVNGGVIFEWVDTLNGFTDLLAGKIEIIGRLQVHPEIG